MFSFSGKILIPFTDCHYNYDNFAVSLRLQLTSSEFKGVVPEKAFGDFLFCSLVLFFVVVSFMG